MEPVEIGGEEGQVCGEQVKFMGQGRGYGGQLGLMG